jgi:hypothetical protein
MTRVRKVLIAFAILVIMGGVSGYLGRGWIRDRMHEASQPPLPPEETYEEQEERANLPAAGDLEGHVSPPTILPAEQSVEDADSDDVEILPEKLLAVPFTSQAPFKEWDELHEEACEESSVIMVAGYYRGDRGAYEPEEAEAMILELVAFAEENGFDIDTTAEETAELVELFYPDLEADVVPMTGPESVKRYISQGIPVILPAYGKALPNPNFRNGGPLYHMLVVRGYTEDRFITNDPGTRLGEKFLYTYGGLLDAVHDWNNGDVPNGERVMLIVRRR